MTAPEMTRLESSRLRSRHAGSELRNTVGFVVDSVANCGNAKTVGTVADVPIPTVGSEHHRMFWQIQKVRQENFILDRPSSGTWF
jgi:hypothetical protein